MNAPAPARNFTAALAVREHVPLLVGLMGPSGSGKTFSALRLATGIQSIAGGDIYMIDTEARRGLHYADRFKFKHIGFEAPFGSLDYLEAIKFAVDQGGKVIVVDSMSHEHEGPGGMLDFQEQELTRMAGDDYRKRESMKMLAWQKPKAARRRLINGLLQLNANFVFCFRAKNSVKPMRVNGKTEVVPQGFVPIAGDEFVFEMTMNALLLPGAEGLPTWRSENVGERTMIKLPEQFRHLMSEPRPLDERMGKDLATWARGGAPVATGTAVETRSFEARDGGQPTTLAERVTAYRKRLADAPNTTKAKSIYAASIGLRDDLDRGDPDEAGATAADLEREFNARFAALEDDERGGR